MIKTLKQKYTALPVQLRASFWFVVCSVLQRGVSVLTTPIFTRLLSTGDYGQYTVFTSWLDIVSIFVTLRLYYGVFARDLVKFSEDKAAYASAMQGLGLVLCSLWTLAYLLFRDFWNDLLGLSTVQMLAMLTMVWATGAFRFWAATEQNEYKYRSLVLITLTVSLLKPALGVALVLHAEDKATARILGLAVAELLGYSWLFFLQLRRGRRFCSWQYWRRALLFNIPLLPHYLSQAVLNGADRIMIRDMVGMSQAGIYGLAYSLSRLLGMLNQALVQSFSPWAYRKLKHRREEEIDPIATGMLILVAVLNLLLIAFAPELVALFAPRAYRDAIWIIPPVAMSVYFTFSFNLFSLAEFYFEKRRMMLFASVGAAALNVLLNYLLIPRFGYYAAGYTTLLCYMLYSLGHFLFSRRICRAMLDGHSLYDSRRLLLLTAAFLALGFTILFAYGHPLLRYLLIGLLLALAFCFRARLSAAVATVLRLDRRDKSQP